MSVIAAYYYKEGKRIREIALDERFEQDEPPRLLRRPIGFSHAASGRQAELR